MNSQIIKINTSPATDCMTLGAQMFKLVSAKVLMLLSSNTLDIPSFAAILKQEGITNVDLLREGFLLECRKHHLSTNEAQYLFNHTKFLLAGPMSR